MITIETKVNNTIDQVWNAWTKPEHIVNWNFASDDWHAPHAMVDLRIGGEFVTTMAAKDGSMLFDFGGTYTNVVHHQIISYTLEDNRKVEVHFSTNNSNEVMIIQKFDPESENTHELQQAGWQ
ncbi:MAG: SRPBCC domain-containing protein, partial [Cytophagales bacterium]